ncbi:hypothetical protein [Roseimarinus sediminis]|uniref:hypothetical protein n=1 Tax=Roseimarinus sediminis TaxID=1610899 RepID=UPI003D1E1130
MNKMIYALGIAIATTLSTHHQSEKNEKPAGKPLTIEQPQQENTNEIPDSLHLIIPAK